MLRFREWIDDKRYQVAGLILGALAGSPKDLLRKWGLEKVEEDDKWIAVTRTKNGNYLSRSELRELARLHTKDPDGEGVPYYFSVKDKDTGKLYVWYSDEHNWMPLNTKEQRKKAMETGIHKGLKRDQVDFVGDEVRDEHFS